MTMLDEVMEQEILNNNGQMVLSTYILPRSGGSGNGPDRFTVSGI